ncbi:General secretion pathway protein E [Candidatus Rhodobacter oscarellae]|uniref:General secretion pathway protein E n=1 Tax=Candidatus Rhodobacter oscarellae TaxID=1675527 RepID=A0A0J9ECH1_9RHOB|nr:ATPase, T2SS/T4P/T4SS family [Candidatus Rhodobacter lobularis]KMW59409.1 General secretion pathway protein E [Candidatus Rhodobacter lobularis]
MTAIPYRFASAQKLVVTPESETCVYAAETPLAALAEAQRVTAKALRFQQVSDVVLAEQMEDSYRDSATEAAGAAEQARDTDADLAALADSAAAVDDLLDQREDAPVVRLINALLLEAIRGRASDVHIEAEEHHLVVRFRVDGILREALRSNRALAPQLISRIKVMGRLDIAEKRLPQDGRVSLRVAEFHLDARISTIPTQHGERVVMRLLDRGQTRVGVVGLGMTQEMQATFEQLLERPDGLILVTGPTGSGKTTTLYAGLDRLNDRQRNIMTIEDPIEYALPGIAQMQVNPATDLTFARGLRALLRQDPNVIMVGEIRDGETARTAVESAMTGHLVLSTLHTNSAIGSIARLLDLGVERFLLAPMLRGLLAQRLVRRVCPNCATDHEVTPSEAALMSNLLRPGERILKGLGCEECHQTGYHGRAALYDLIEVTPRLEQAIAAGAPEADLAATVQRSVPGLISDGVAKIRQRQTTPQEVARVIFETTANSAA